MAHNSVILDKNLITGYLNREEYQHITHYLKEKFVVTRNDVTGQPNPLSVDELCLQILAHIVGKLAAFEDLTVDLLCLVKEVFRSLRNCAVLNPRVQTMISNDKRILQNTDKLLERILNVNGNSDCVKMILQFLTNVVAQNPNAALSVWNTFNKRIVELFTESEYSYLAAALLYNILFLQSSLVKECEQVYQYVLERVIAKDENEYHTFLLEIFIQDLDFMKLYTTFEAPQRLVILSALEHFINESESFSLNFSIVQTLTTVFKHNSDSILKTVSTYVDTIEPQEVALLLEILAKLSSQENYCKQLQNDVDVIINCAFLLRSIHSLGKESQNNFTPIQKLSEVTSTNAETQKDPIYGFKADLVRFLGNMCWKNRNIQDTIRELECIPLLLDCCNIDARNPFIIQWSIFAIRNLCDNNPENQAVIAGMTKQGAVDCAVLQEMGLTLHNDGTNKIIIGPIPGRNEKL